MPGRTIPINRHRQGALRAWTGLSAAVLAAVVVALTSCLGPEPAKLEVKPAGTGRSVAIRCRWRLVKLGQCEAICWVPEGAGAGLLITNEGRDIYRIPPAAATRPATSS